MIHYPGEEADPMTETKKRQRSEAQKQYEKRYAAANTRFVGLKLNHKTDADILAKLESVDNMQAYIKQCIRADLAKN